MSNLESKECTEKTRKGRANNRGTMAGLVAPAIAVYALQTNAREALRISKHETYPLVLALETTRATKLFRNFIIRLIASTAIFHSSPLQNSNRKDDFSSENL